MKNNKEVAAGIRFTEDEIIFNKIICGKSEDLHILGMNRCFKLTAIWNRNTNKLSLGVKPYILFKGVESLLIMNIVYIEYHDCETMDEVMFLVEDFFSAKLVEYMNSDNDAYRNAVYVSLVFAYTRVTTYIPFDLENDTIMVSETANHVEDGYVKPMHNFIIREAGPAVTIEDSIKNDGRYSIRCVKSSSRKGGNR